MVRIDQRQNHDGSRVLYRLPRMHAPIRQRFIVADDVEPAGMEQEFVRLRHGGGVRG